MYHVLSHLSVGEVRAGLSISILPVLVGASFLQSVCMHVFVYVCVRFCRQHPSSPRRHQLSAKCMYAYVCVYVCVCVCMCAYIYYHYHLSSGCTYLLGRMCMYAKYIHIRTFGHYICMYVNA